VPDLYKPSNTNVGPSIDKLGGGLVKNYASLLYHPLTQLWISAFRDGIVSACIILDVLSDGELHSVKSIQIAVNERGRPLTYGYVYEILYALRNGGLSFTEQTDSKGSGSNELLWQLPIHPAASQLHRLKQILFTTSLFFLISEGNSEVNFNDTFSLKPLVAAAPQI